MGNLFFDEPGVKRQGFGFAVGQRVRVTRGLSEGGGDDYIGLEGVVENISTTPGIRYPINVRFTPVGEPLTNNGVRVHTSYTFIPSELDPVQETQNEPACSAAPPHYEPGVQRDPVQPVHGTNAG